MYFATTASNGMAVESDCTASSLWLSSANLPRDAMRKHGCTMRKRGTCYQPVSVRLSVTLVCCTVTA